MENYRRLDGKAMEAMHEANNAFVKSNEMKLKKMAGKPAELKASECMFNAQMMNTGEHAQDLARGLTKGLDKTAFPVK